ncbi:MAG TPA: amino acid permease [Deltaproteobacteria bacterium]|nr:amino acid permease [Deltaproteobacteria bacterium]
MAADVQLKKNVLGFPSLFAIAVGIVVASTTLVSLGQGMGLGGYGFIWAMCIAFILMLFQACTFSELAITMPRAGSVSSYTEIAMGHFLAIVSVISGYVIVQLLAAPAELCIAGLVAQTCFWPGLNPTVVSVVILVLLVILNLLGVDLFANFQILFTAVMIFTMALIGLGGTIGAGNPAVVMKFSPPPVTFTDAFALSALGVWLFIGTEFMCPMIEEAKNPRRDIPLAMMTGLAVILIIKILYGIASVRYVAMEELAQSPIPHVLVAKAIFGTAGFYWVGIASLCATASTVNTLIAAVPRMLYGMAHAGQVPSIFKYLHPRFRTPWVGIILLSAGMLVQILTSISSTQTIVVFIVASAFSWLLSYIIAHIDCIILRFRYQELERPFKTPGFPVPQILGIAGTVFIMVNIFPDPAVKRMIYAYAGWFLLGAAVYAFCWCQFKMKKGFFRPTPLEEALKE